MRLTSGEVQWGTRTNPGMSSVLAPLFAGNRLHVLFLVVAFISYAATAGNANAQTRCAPGATPGSLACQPDQYQSDAPTTIIKTVGHWDKTWGAVADGTNSIGAVSAGELSKRAAEASALKSCADRGGQGCAVSFTYFNQCIALIDPGTSDEHMSVQAGESIEVASDLGLKACKERTGLSSCKVTYSRCTDPIYRK